MLVSIGMLLVLATPASAALQYTSNWGGQVTPGSFSYPEAVATDPGGNVYVVDSANYRVIKFDSSGAFLTQWGGFGFGNGQFEEPHGIAVDAFGNVYVADGMSGLIQKFNSSGTFLGSFGSGQSQPWAVATDSLGNVYVTDPSVASVKKFDSFGNFISDIGSVGEGDGELLSAVDVAVDPSDNVYVTDAGNGRVQKFSSNGTFIAKWGSFGSGDGQFSSAAGISVDPSGDIYVTDTSNPRVQKFDSSGNFITKWGTVGSGDGQFSQPSGVAASSGAVYVADPSAVRIQKFTLTGVFLSKWGHRPHGGDGELFSPRGVASGASGNLYVADTFNNRVQKFDADGTFLSKWGSQGAGNGQFNSPSGTAVDTAGNVYVADTVNNRVQKFDSNGAFQSGASVFGSAPLAVATDLSDNLYVAWGNDQIGKYNPSGGFVTSWGGSGSGDAQFSGSTGLAVDAAGSVYVRDYFNDRVQKFSSTGAFVTKWGSAGTGDGQLQHGHPSAAQATGIGIARTGDVYVADDGNCRVQKFDPSGAFLGKIGSCGSGNAQFNAIRGVAGDATGHLYVADSNNNRIQKFLDEEAAAAPDTIPPETLIRSGPTGTTAATTASFTFSTNEAGSSFECKLDSESFSPCGSPQGYSGLSHGSHTFSVRATDPALNTDSTPATRTWTVDATPPDTTITSASGLSNSDTATFSFSSSEPGSSFECKLDSADFTTCFSPKTYPGVASGSHTFSVRATDAVGNVDPTPDSRTWTAMPPPIEFVVNFGPPVPGGADGSFNQPGGAALDSAGNVYIADTGNGRIQKFDSTGNFLTKWAVSSPLGVAVDSADNVYVAESASNRIKKFSPSASPTTPPTFAMQWGTLGTGDGQFNAPYNVSTVTVGPNTYVYVADYNNNRIQKFSSTGVFITKWGSSGTGNNQYQNPTSAIPDATDTYVYVADYLNNRIQKVTSAGAFVTKWGTAGSGNGQFNRPLGAAPDSAGNVYVTDSNNHRVQKFTPNANPNLPPPYSAQFGGSGTGDGQFNTPAGGAIGSGVGYIVDFGNSRVQKFDLSVTPPSFVLKWGQFSGASGGELSGPEGVAVGGDVYVSDTGHDRVQRFSSTGAFLSTTGSSGSGNGQFLQPKGLALGAGGATYVVDSQNSRIQKLDGAGNYVGQWGSAGSGPSQFQSPRGVAVGLSGDVYVADSGNSRISQFDSTGSLIRNWGSFGTGDSQFQGAHDVAVDSVGDVYVADSNNWIKKFDSTGQFLMKWGGTGPDDGQFDTPIGIAIDAADNVYVAEYGSNRVQKFRPSGTFIMRWGSLGSGDGQFNSPRDIAVDGSGNVYVADFVNNRIEKFRSTDTTPPDTTVNSEPPASTFDTDASFSFTSSEGGIGFECKLDSGAYTACPSPKSYSGLSQGEHTFSVRAIDFAGNPDPTPATRTWAIGEEASGTTPPSGGTISTGSNPTSSDPVESSVTTPDQRSVDITEQPAGSSPSGFTFADWQVDISVSGSAASPTDPFKLEFLLDASVLPPGVDHTNLVVFKDNTQVPDCDATPPRDPGTVSPTPSCVSERAAVPSGGGDVKITVLTTTASAWNFGVANGAIVVRMDSLPNDPQDVSFTAAGGLSPTTFSLDDDADPTLSDTRTLTNVLPAADYSISETLPSGWKQADAKCSDGSPVSNIQISPAETVTCTFVNQKIYFDAPNEASPLTVSLVPDFRQTQSSSQCSARGGVSSSHGLPDLPGGTNPDGSCNPPGFTPGTVAHFGTQASASAQLGLLAGDLTTVADEADVSVVANATDVRGGSATGADYNPVAAGPDVTLSIKFRLSDTRNGGSQNQPGTLVDQLLNVPVACTTTPSTTVGATCSANTTMDAVTPGIVLEGKQSVFQSFRARLLDSGSNGARGDGDDRGFAMQGIYIP